MAKLKERYANALLELSEESGTIGKDIEQAVLIRDALKNADVRLSYESRVPDSAKQELFDNFFSEKLSKHLMGFLYLMIRKIENHSMYFF